MLRGAGAGGERRLLLVAERRLGERTAGMEAAAAGQADRAGRVADDRGSLGHASRNELGDGAEQALRVRVARIREELVHRRRLDDPAEVHHRDPVADVADDRHVVRDQEQRQPELRRAAPRAGSAPSPARRRRAPRPARRRRARRARARARARCSRAGAGRRRTAADRRRATRAPRPTRSSSSRQRASICAFGTISCARSSSASVCLTVMRGLSDEYGSWNTIWIRRRVARLALRRERRTLVADLAGCRRVEADDAASERRLAAARLADEPERLAPGELEVDAVDRAQHLRSAARAAAGRLRRGAGSASRGRAPRAAAQPPAITGSLRTSVAARSGWMHAVARPSPSGRSGNAPSMQSSCANGQRG